MLMCLLVDSYNNNVFENGDGDSMLCVRWDLLKCISSPITSLFLLEVMDAHLSLKVSWFVQNKSLHGIVWVSNMGNVCFGDTVSSKFTRLTLES